MMAAATDVNNGFKIFPSLERTLKTVSASAYIPKHDGNSGNPLGEDAHFLSDTSYTIGVADGVGSWARKGIDAGEYSRQLMANTSLSVQSHWTESTDINPRTVLYEAFLNTEVDGSSTACVLTLTHDGYLSCFNVGDSGFMVIRGGDIVYKSPIQQKRFNCPFQIGNQRSNPSVGEAIRVKIQAWDIVIVATDGLFDNVFDFEIKNLLQPGVEEEQEMPEDLATRIAEYAFLKAEDKVSMTPFALAAQAAGHEHTGGKHDDITVVVAYVLPSEVADRLTDEQSRSSEIELFD